MELTFIGQGLDPTSNSTAGNLIIDTLADEQYNSFNAFVAFVSIGGLNNILVQLSAFQARGGNIRLYIGVDLNGTSKEALEKLIELEIETYIVFSPNNIIYHPKIYTFEGDIFSRAIVGSSNLTERGLFQSVESSVCVTFHNEDDEMGIEFLKAIYEHYNQIISNEHPSCQLLTNEILEILVANKIVIPEAINREKLNKINKEFGEKDAADYDALLINFGKLKSKRPPRGFRKVATKEEIIVEQNNELNIINETFELPEGSMWVETGRMTGGSKNQLDVSKRGVLNGEEIDGSVSYFGIDPDDTDTTLDIDLHLGNKIYIGNTIKYTPDNSNWRIQLKGRTENGERLTAISRMRLGQDGGFVNKTLLFTRIDDANYKLEILDTDDRDKLIEHSSVWGKMGNETTGRAYGFI
ncbi:MAG TPA: phospholipase D family protein [Puia sp.]|nr:phospholipase D family protein [Puia sp.]